MQKQDEEQYNPLGQDTVGEMLRKRADAEQRKVLLEEEIQDYSDAVNRLFSSPDGKYFLGKLIKYIGRNSFDKDINPAKMIEDRGKNMVYLELIRPYLDKTVLMEMDY